MTSDPSDSDKAEDAQPNELDKAEEERLEREANDRLLANQRRLAAEVEQSCRRADDDRRERSPEVRSARRLVSGWSEWKPGDALPARQRRAPDLEPTPERLRRRLAGMLEGIPPKYEGVTWELPDLTKRVRRAGVIALARDAHEALRHGETATVLLAGPSGTGKSTLASAMFHDLVERMCRSAERAIEKSPSKAFRWTALWMPAKKLALARSQYRLGSGEAPEVERAIAADVLVVDDLGRGDPPERVGALIDVLDERDAHQRTTIVTTGLRYHQLVARYDDGTARRLTEPPTLTITCGEWTNEAKLRTA